MQAMIMLADASGVPTGNKGHREFPSLPRIGEALVENDSQGTGQIYRVVDVHYDMDNPALCDVWVVHAGALMDNRIPAKNLP